MGQVRGVLVWGSYVCGQLGVKLEERWCGALMYVDS